jgi:hypothetical protein
MSVKTGRCKTCDYEPVAFDARLCPRCGASHPNPGPTNRYVARLAPAGALLGGFGGAVWGYYGFKMGGAGAFGGFVLGVLAGLVLGLLAGMAAGLVSWLCGLCQPTRKPSWPREAKDLSLHETRIPEEFFRRPDDSRFFQT